MSGYITDPNDNKKQVPGALPDNAFDRSVTPQTCSFTKTPNSVLFGEVAAEVGFFFGSSASFASIGAEADDSRRITGSQHYSVVGTPAAGTTLNIHPTAYSCSKADKGKVFFVYHSGLSTGPR
tara:strand:+ start:119 stop:487 length:369 start_codon:yes stop_codon:yes gene_type:complete